MKILLLLLISVFQVLSFDKIVSVGIDATDVLINLKQANKIIGADSNSLNNYKSLESELIGADDIDRILSLEPDAVVFGAKLQGNELASTLKENGIKIFQFKKCSTKESFAKELRACGDFLGKFNWAVDLETDYNTKFATIELVNAMNASNKKLLFIKQIDDKLLVAPSSSVEASIIRTSGFKQIYSSKSEWTKVTKEELDISDYILIDEASFEKLTGSEIMNDYGDKIVLTNYSFKHYCLNTPDDILVLLNQINNVKY